MIHTQAHHLNAIRANPPLPNQGGLEFFGLGNDHRDTSRTVTRYCLRRPMGEELGRGT